MFLTKGSQRAVAFRLKIATLTALKIIGVPMGGTAAQLGRRSPSLPAARGWRSTGF